MARTMRNFPPHDAQAKPAAAGMAGRHAGLRQPAAREAAGHWAALLVFFGILHASAAVRGALPGAVCAALVLAVVHGLLGYRLTESRPCGLPPGMCRLGTANRLTLLRGLLVSLTAGFLFVRPGAGSSSHLIVWLPGLFYLTAAVLDGVDGAWARRSGTQSALGKALDGDMDALGVLVACGVAVGNGRLPLYYLAAGLVYYVYQLGLWLRRHRGRPIYPAPPRGFARLVAGFQMGFLGVALLPMLGAARLAVAAPVFLLPLLAGFAWDWLHVTGRWDDRLDRQWRKMCSLLAAAGPAGGRVLILGIVVTLFAWAWRDVSPGAVLAAIAIWGWPQWLAFAAVNLVILAAMCWRWWFILRRMGQPVGFAALVGYRMGANTLSYITPGPQFGGEPLQVHCLVDRHQVPAEAATAAVGVDRLVELMGNLLFLSLAGALVLPALLAEKTALLPVIAAMVAAVLGIGLLFAAIGSGVAPISRMAARLSAWIGHPRALAGPIAFVEAGERRAAGILTERVWGWYALGGLLQWSGFLVELWLIYGFLGQGLNATALLTVAVAARLAFLLPLPGGLGALEAGQMLAVIHLGGDPAMAAAACGIMRLRDLVLISTGGVLAVRWMRLFKRPNPRRPSAPA